MKDFLYACWLKLNFILNFPWLIFPDAVFSFFFFFFCQLKDHKIILSLTFALLNNFFHHKYDDENFSKGNKKQGSLRNQFPRRTSFHAKPVSLWNTNIGCWSSLSPWCRSNLFNIGLLSKGVRLRSLILFCFVVRANKILKMTD